MGKAQIVHFSVAIIVFEMKMQSTSTPKNGKGQSHLVTLAKVLFG